MARQSQLIRAFWIVCHNHLYTFLPLGCSIRRASRHQTATGILPPDMQLAATEPCGHLAAKRPLADVPADPGPPVLFWEVFGLDRLPGPGRQETWPLRAERVPVPGRVRHRLHIRYATAPAATMT